ncbi:MAG: hypothetical protein CME62_17925 [Halobacteriovoraceae bacterium]|nr:hypothetical protein [Halobacteriovoraceae bacterium]|tara:strand:+ start:4223 stop:4504 length:282 start_codon:yes stop_codon:yes gene_type:complete
MNLKKFTILTRNESIQADEKANILINLEHIVSIKPIKMTTERRDVIDGYWIRLSNGKKYRAIQIPEFIQDKFNEELPAISKNNEFELADFNIQ